MTLYKVLSQLYVHDNEEGSMSMHCALQNPALPTRKSQSISQVKSVATSQTALFSILHFFKQLST